MSKFIASFMYTQLVHTYTDCYLTLLMISGCKNTSRGCNINDQPVASEIRSREKLICRNRKVYTLSSVINEVVPELKVTILERLKIEIIRRRRCILCMSVILKTHWISPAMARGPLLRKTVATRIV